MIVAFYGFVAGMD